MLGLPSTEVLSLALFFLFLFLYLKNIYFLTTQMFCLHVVCSAHRGQKRVSDLLEVVIVDCEPLDDGMLGTKLKSSRRVAGLLNSQPPV